MTKTEYAAQHNGNRERIGTIRGVSTDGLRILVLGEDWEPAISDMFFVEGVHALDPQTAKDTQQDLGFMVAKARPIAQNLTGLRESVTELEIQPGIRLTGPYANAHSWPIDGGAIYRPAGAVLRVIQELWASHHS